MASVYTAVGNEAECECERDNPQTKSIVERTERSIQPRLVSSAIREPPISAADGNIENKVECYQKKKKSTFFSFKV
jgi:hypothetical protein